MEPRKMKTTYQDQCNKNIPVTMNQKNQVYNITTESTSKQPIISTTMKHQGEQNGSKSKKSSTFNNAPGTNTSKSRKNTHETGQRHTLTIRQILEKKQAEQQEKQEKLRLSLQNSVKSTDTASVTIHHFSNNPATTTKSAQAVNMQSLNVTAKEHLTPLTVRINQNTVTALQQKPSVSSNSPATALVHPVSRDRPSVSAVTSTAAGPYMIHQSTVGSRMLDMAKPVTTSVTDGPINVMSTTQGKQNAFIIPHYNLAVKNFVLPGDVVKSSSIANLHQSTSVKDKDLTETPRLVASQKTCVPSIHELMKTTSPRISQHLRPMSHVLPPLISAVSTSDIAKVSSAVGSSMYENRSSTNLSYLHPLNEENVTVNDDCNYKFTTKGMLELNQSKSFIEKEKNASSSVEFNNIPENYINEPISEIKNTRNNSVSDKDVFTLSYNTKQCHASSSHSSSTAIYNQSVDWQHPNLLKKTLHDTQQSETSGTESTHIPLFASNNITEQDKIPRDDQLINTPMQLDSALEKQFSKEDLQKLQMLGLVVGSQPGPCLDNADISTIGSFLVSTTSKSNSDANCVIELGAHQPAFNSKSVHPNTIPESQTISEVIAVQPSSQIQNSDSNSVIISSQQKITETTRNFNPFENASVTRPAPICHPVKMSLSSPVTEAHPIGSQPLNVCSVHTTLQGLVPKTQISSSTSSISKSSNTETVFSSVSRLYGDNLTESSSVSSKIKTDKDQFPILDITSPPSDILNSQQFFPSVVQHSLSLVVTTNNRPTSCPPTISNDGLNVFNTTKSINQTKTSLGAELKNQPSGCHSDEASFGTDIISPPDTTLVFNLISRRVEDYNPTVFNKVPTSYSSYTQVMENREDEDSCKGVMDFDELFASYPWLFFDKVGQEFHCTLCNTCIISQKLSYRSVQTCRTEIVLHENSTEHQKIVQMLITSQPLAGEPSIDFDQNVVVSSSKDMLTTLPVEKEGYNITNSIISKDNLACKTSEHSNDSDIMMKANGLDGFPIENSDTSSRVMDKNTSLVETNVNNDPCQQVNLKNIDPESQPKSDDQLHSDSKKIITSDSDSNNEVTHGNAEKQLSSGGGSTKLKPLLQKMKKDWFDMYEWLVLDIKKEVFYCKICRSVGKKNIFSKGKAVCNPRKCEFHQHNNAIDHQDAVTLSNRENQSNQRGGCSSETNDVSKMSTSESTKPVNSPYSTRKKSKHPQPKRSKQSEEGSENLLSELTEERLLELPYDKRGPQKRRIQIHWFTEFPWLHFVPKNDLFYCTWCIKAQNTNIFTSGKLADNPKKDTFAKHEANSDHQKAALVYKSQTAEQKAGKGDSDKDQGPVYFIDKSLVETCGKRDRPSGSEDDEELGQLMKIQRCSSKVHVPFDKRGPLKRRIKPHWFTEYRWLTYDRERDKFFCKYCVNAQVDSILTKGKPADNPKKDTFTKHEATIDHQLAGQLYQKLHDTEAGEETGGAAQENSQPTDADTPSSSQERDTEPQSNEGLTGHAPPTTRSAPEETTFSTAQTGNLIDITCLSAKSGTISNRPSQKEGAMNTNMNASVGVISNNSPPDGAVSITSLEKSQNLPLQQLQLDQTLVMQRPPESEVNCSADSSTVIDSSPWQLSFWGQASSLRQCGGLCDITLSVMSSEGKVIEYKAHKLLLVCASDYFRSLYNKNELKDRYHFNNLTSQGLASVLAFIYGDSINGSQKAFGEAYEVACALSVTKAKELFKQLMCLSGTELFTQTSPQLQDVLQQTQALQTTENTFLDVHDDTSMDDSNQLRSLVKDIILPSLEEDSSVSSSQQNTFNLPVNQQVVDDVPVLTAGSNVISNDGITSTSQINNDMSNKTIAESNTKKQNIKEISRTEKHSASKSAANSTNRTSLSRLRKTSSWREKKKLLSENLPSCDICDKRFLKKESVMLHKEKRHRKESSGPELPALRYKCEHCPRTYARLTSLKIHQRNHTGERPYLCTVCGKTFTQRVILLQHSVIHTDIEKPLKCDTCGKKFRKSVDLNRHVIGIHSGRTPFQCDLCGMAFSWRASLVKHLQRHKGPLDRPFLCSQCDLTFVRKFDLERHQVTHTKVKSFRCDWCFQMFTQKGSMVKHVKDHCKMRLALMPPEPCGQLGQ